MAQVGFVKVSENDFYHHISELDKDILQFKKVKELYVDKNGKIYFVMENERRVENNKKICYNIFENKNEREDNPFLQGIGFNFDSADSILQNVFEK